MIKTWSAKRLAIMLAVGITSLFLIQAARSADNPLPPEARQALDRGLIAAEQEAWELAIGYFTQAQQKAERNARVLYTLGMAHARAGHYLAGAAWLRAYLASQPNASNEEAVRKEAARLEGIVQADMKKVFTAALAAARQIASDEIRGDRLYAIMRRQALTGNWEEAQKTEKETSDLWRLISPGKKDEIETLISSVLRMERISYLSAIGEVQEALGALNREGDFWDFREESLLHIARSQTRLGDFAGAEKTLGKVEHFLDIYIQMVWEKGAGDRSWEADRLTATVALMLNLADAYAENGQVPQRRRVLSRVKWFAGHTDMGPEMLKKIAAAEKSDLKGKRLREAFGRRDSVEEWITLAREMSEDRAIVDLKGILESAGKGVTPDAIADGLSSAALSLGKRLGQIRALEKKFSPRWQSALRGNTPGTASTSQKPPAEQLREAITEGDAEKVKALLSSNPELVNARLENDWTSTPLLLALKEKYKDVVELLVACKADVNVPSKNSWSAPLLLATEWDDMDVVALLVNSNADVNRASRDGDTPLHKAAARGNFSVVELLISRKAKIEVVDNMGITPLHWASRVDAAKDVVKVLLTNKGNPNAKDKDGTTPLHLAALRGAKANVELLLIHKGDVNAKDKEGKRPLDCAESSGHKGVAELLRRHGGKSGK